MLLFCLVSKISYISFPSKISNCFLNYPINSQKQANKKPLIMSLTFANNIFIIFRNVSKKNPEMEMESSEELYIFLFCFNFGKQHVTTKIF